MSLAVYIPLVGCLCNVFFALFVFLQAPKAKANRIYLLLGLSIAAWNLGSFRLFVVTDRAQALFWGREVFIGVLFALAAYNHLSLLIAEYRVRWIPWLYVFLGVLALVDCTPYFIRDVVYLGPSGWYSQAGPTFHLINIPYALSFFSVTILWKRRKTLPHLQRRRLTSLILAQIILFILGLNDLLPIMGIYHYPFTNAVIYPYGSLAAVFYGIIISYSVLQHQLLDVHVTLSRYAAHAIRFAFLFFAATALLLLMALATNAFDTRSLGLALLVFLATSILTSIFFPRLFGSTGFEKWERRILGDRFEYQDQVRNFIANMTWYSELSHLLDDLHGLLTQTFHFSSYQIILRDETTRAFTLFRTHPEEPHRILPELNYQSPVFQYFELDKGEYLTLRPSSFRTGTSQLQRQAREQLVEFEGELCFALSSQSEIFGLLLVGNKSTGDPFTANDINLLVTLVKTMGLMINQIRLKNQILNAQELDLLGRMSRGMAHDLNNLLTPISTLLQLQEETGILDDELLPVAARNVGMMRAYIREALFFSEHLRPDMQIGRLDVLVLHAIEVAGNSRQKPVELIPVIPGEIVAEIDSVLIQRLIANLITNAIDASPAGGQVRVELEQLAKTDEHRDWLRVRVIDQGEGISRENLNRVLTPYFTTKNRGDENRGFGLGLAICRKIATLHGGSLTIESQLRKGTTVQLDLPSRQIQASTPHLVSPQAA